MVNTTETYPGKGGSNLVLTIDTEFQKKIEEIAKKSVEEMTDPAADRVYIVVMNPKKWRHSWNYREEKEI